MYFDNVINFNNDEICRDLTRMDNIDETSRDLINFNNDETSRDLNSSKDKQQIRRGDEMAARNDVDICYLDDESRHSIDWTCLFNENDWTGYLKGGKRRKNHPSRG